MAQDDGFLSRWSRRKLQPSGGEPLAERTERARPATTSPGAAPALAVPVEQPVADPVDGTPVATPMATPATPPAEPPPTLEEAQQLTPDADFTRFVGRDVDPQVKNAALKNLFSDPQFNVMDGLDIYIDDYGKPDPLPPGMLERMTQSAFLGLFRKTPEEEAAARAQADGQAPAATPAAAPADSGQTNSPDSTQATAPAATAAQAPSPNDTPDPPLDEDPDLRLQRHDDAGRTGTGQGPGTDPGRQR